MVGTILRRWLRRVVPPPAAAYGGRASVERTRALRSVPKPAVTAAPPPRHLDRGGISGHTFPRG
jgi:hypothetical protein